MRTYFKLAWRNLWRNKRRTAITIASIFFGVFFAVFMSSVQKGSMENMIENMVRYYSGYIQIQDSSFYDNRSVNHALEFTGELDQLLHSVKGISRFTQRIESFALASSGEQSRGAAVFGILPEEENSISELARWVAEGEYLQNGSNGVMIGKTLAENLQLNPGDTLVLLGQGYHGTTAAGKYPIAALLDFPIQEMNNNLVYMELDNCRELFSIPGKSTAIVIMTARPDRVNEIADNLTASVEPGLQVYTWDVLLKEIKSLVEGKLASGRIIKGILFMVIGFGIWGTIIMLMSERKREFGIMIALGVKKFRLGTILLIESILIGILGIIAGFLFSFPLVYYFFMNPILVTGDVAETYATMGFEPVIKFSIQPEIFYNPAITIFVLFALIFLYPMFFLKRLKTATALRS